jgi:hypothetical protein
MHKTEATKMSFPYQLLGIYIQVRTEHCSKAEAKIFLV